MTRTLNPEAQLLELLRNSDEPTAADLERNRKALALRFAAGAAVTTALLAEERGTWLLQGGKLAAWLKGTSVAALIVAGGFTAYSLWPSPRTSTTTAVQAVVANDADTRGTPAPAVPVDPAPVESAEPVIDTSKPGVSALAPRTASSRGVAARYANNLEEELEIIGRAQKALKSGQPDQALQALDEHQRRFPAGVLSFERVGVRTVALCQAGRLDEGQTQARRYLKQVPNSVLSKRIRVACQITDE